MDGLAGALNATQLEYLGVAKQSCDKLRVCINDLLDATRLETGKMTLEIKSTSLGELLRKVILSAERVAAGKNIEIFQNIDPNLPILPMDESRITQVITNLLNNAIKF